MTALACKHVTLSYEGVPALEGVNFEVEKGEYVFLVGHNGSGKSTLLKCIVGLHALDAGEIVCSFPRQNIAYLPQTNAFESDFPATVYEVVLSGTQKPSRRLPFYQAADRRAAERAIETLGIANIAGKRIGSLSGGQQQRALLARALCRQPALLVLDEPCAGLDPTITHELYHLLHDFNTQQGITILMASHDLASVCQQQDNARVLELSRKVVFDGTVAQWKAVNHQHTQEEIACKR